MSQTYKGRKLDNIAFPMGGLGAGMICIDGTGSFDCVSIRNKPDMYNEPEMFAAVSLKGFENSARVLEGQVPFNKIYGSKVRGKHSAGMGMGSTSYGLPRFRNCEFTSHFPFAEIFLSDEDLPYDCRIKGYSPFIPGNEDSSSLPAASVEYTITNKTDIKTEGVFYFSAFNFVGIEGGRESLITRPYKNGYIFEQKQFSDKKSDYAAFSVNASKAGTVNTDFYKGGWWDSFTLLWKEISGCKAQEKTAEEKDSPGAYIAIPFILAEYS